MAMELIAPTQLRASSVKEECNQVSTKLGVTLMLGNSCSLYQLLSNWERQAEFRGMRFIKISL
jgi:hypothetical protein